MKYWLIVFVLLFGAVSSKQIEETVVVTDGLIICTNYRNYLIYAGFNNIFPHQGKYCVYIFDNSTDVLFDLMSWINGLEEELFETFFASTDEFSDKPKTSKDEVVGFTAESNENISVGAFFIRLKINQLKAKAFKRVS